MKITKRQLRKIVKEAALNEFFGGKEKKEKRAKATQELQKAAMDYINDFSSSKVGPFLKKGDDVRGPYNVKGRLDPEGEYYSQVIRQDLTDNDLAHGQRLDDEQHEEMKKHHEVLEGIKDAWESATGKRADNDDAPFDVRYVSKALAIPSLYLRGNPDSANEGKKMKVTKRQLRGIIRETIEATEGYPAIKEFDRITKEGDLALKSWLKFMARRGPSELQTIADLWDGMVANPGDVAAAKELAASLGINDSRIAGAATFHARKMSPGADYPSGAELQDLVTAYRDESDKRRSANPPKPRPKKPYGGGTRNRPWDRST